MTDQTPAERRAFLIHYAKVHLSEVRRRRHQRGFAASLLASASRARREAQQIDTSPQQREMAL